MAPTRSLQEKFEDKIFNERFIRGVKKVNNGQFPYKVDCPTKDELFRRDATGNYVDESISAMWFGFKLGHEIGSST